MSKFTVHLNIDLINLVGETEDDAIESAYRIFDLLKSAILAEGVEVGIDFHGVSELDD